MRRPGEGSAKPPPGEGPVSPPTGLVQGYRTGRTTYGADDDDDDGTKRRAKTVGNGRGDGAVRRKVEAFRRGLGLLVIAHADAMRDSEEEKRATEEEACHLNDPKRRRPLVEGQRRAGVGVSRGRGG